MTNWIRIEVVSECGADCQDCQMRSRRLVKGVRLDPGEARDFGAPLPVNGVREMVGQTVVARGKGCEDGEGYKMQVLMVDIPAVRDHYVYEGGGRIPAPGYIVGGHDRNMGGFK
ncbi:MAG TPA: hypothetical protein VF828_03845 [Patescibacteria group bacterium]